MCPLGTFICIFTPHIKEPDTFLLQYLWLHIDWNLFFTQIAAIRRRMRGKKNILWEATERLNKEKRCKEKDEKEMLRFPLRGRGKKLLQWCSRRREKRRGNSTFHPTPYTAVSANISLLAGSSQAVRRRSGKLRRDRLTARHSLSLIA